MTAVTEDDNDDETRTGGQRADFDNFSTQRNDEIATLLADLNVKTQRKAIRRELTDPYNRLHSIAEDAEFVLRVADSYKDFVLTPNLRCGLWYVPPERIKDSPYCYFKSTDGHIGQWAFSLKRFNPALLAYMSDAKGVIIVDSTRRGKSFPDALSKTIPMWCAVVNRAISIRHNKTWDSTCFTPSLPYSSVSASESHQIQQRLPEWTQALLNSSYTIPNLRAPLQCHHITPASFAADAASMLSAERIHVVCVSASRVTTGGSAERRAGYNYVPGSGDDHESWAPASLTPQIFWKHKRTIMSASRSELFDLLQRLLRRESMMPSVDQASERDIVIEDDNVRLYIGHLDYTQTPHNYFMIQIHAERPLPPEDACNTYCYAPLEIKRHLDAYSRQAGQMAQQAVNAASSGRRIHIRHATSHGNHLDFACALAVLVLVLTRVPEGSAVGPCHDLQATHIKEDVMACHQRIIEKSNGRLVASRDMIKRIHTVLSESYRRVTRLT